MLTATVLTSLLVFGVLYARFLNSLRYRQWPGKRAMLAVVGVTTVTAAAGILHQPDPLLDTLMTLAAFTAAGAPIIIYDVTR